MSSVPSPRVRKPKPRARLNHLTTTISKPPTVGRLRAQARRRQLRRLRAFARRDRQHAEDLHALVAPLRLGHDARAFVDRLKAVAPQHGHVDQHVAFAAVRDDESVALRNVEPFDPPGDFDQADRLFLRRGRALDRERRHTLESLFAHVGPHQRARRLGRRTRDSTRATDEGNGPPGTASSARRSRE